MSKKPNVKLSPSVKVMTLKKSCMKTNIGRIPPNLDNRDENRLAELTSRAINSPGSMNLAKLTPLCNSNKTENTPFQIIPKEQGRTKPLSPTTQRRCIGNLKKSASNVKRKL